MTSRIKTLFILAILPLLNWHCGFYSFSGTSIPDDVEHFTVQYIENKASLVAPLLSQTMTEKLKNKFISETRLSFRQTEGDFDFSGFISDYRVEPVSVQDNATTSLNRLTVTVKINMVCKKHPKLNFDQSFTNFEDFDANQNLSDVEDQLIDQISDNLIQQIFNKAAINW